MSRSSGHQTTRTRGPLPAISTGLCKGSPGEMDDMALHYRRQADKLIVFGQTYPVKEAIKALGGRFNGAAKNWTVPFSEETLAQVKSLCGEEAEGSEAEGSAVKAPLFQDLPEETPNPDRSLKPEALSLRELMDKAAVAVTAAFPGPIWVVGEIENFSRRGDMIFLNLAEAKGAGQGGSLTVKASIWSNAVRYIRDRHGAKALDQLLSDGLKVCLLCTVTLYKDRGQISLSVEDIDPEFTKGALAIAREKLLKELRQKGLDQKQKTLLLPRLPLKVVLLSAEGSRAKSDFLHQLEQGGFPGTVFFQHTAMQGEQVAQMVVQGLVKALAVAPDVIVITRGGGSAADLRWFDSKEVAYAIAQCPVPIVAAIGHHDDMCVAEEICHLRQKTPTAAADFLLELVEQVRSDLRSGAETLSRVLNRRLLRAIEEHSRLLAQLQRDALQSLTARIQRDGMLANRMARLVSSRLNTGLEDLVRLANHLEREVDQKLIQWHRSCDGWANKLSRSTEGKVQEFRDILVELEKRLTRHDPSPWLQKGWTRLQMGDQTLISVADVREDDLVSARLLDGLLQLKITKKTIVSKQTKKEN